MIWIFTSGATLLCSIDLWRISPATEAPVPSVKCQAFTSSHQQSLSCTIIQNPTRGDGPYSSESYSWRSVWQSVRQSVWRSGWWSVWQSVWWSVWKTCPLNLSANCLLCSMFLYSNMKDQPEKFSTNSLRPWNAGLVWVRFSEMFKDIFHSSSEV